MPLDPLLVEVLACPIDKGPLLFFDDEDLLYNPRLRRGYRIRDGIPVMLVDEAMEMDGDEHQRLVEKATEGRVRQTGRPTVSEASEGEERPLAFDP